MIDRTAAARAIEDFLRAIGRDPAREPNLAGTGERVAAAFVDELCDGYAVDVPALLSANASKAPGRDLVVMRDIAVTTMCPHHLMTAKGTAAVAFSPGERIVGIGALVQLVDAFAHRLTLQEEIGAAVANALVQALSPEWAACRLILEHGCVTARGERRHGARMETLAIRGAELTPEQRALAARALGVGA